MKKSRIKRLYRSEKDQKIAGVCGGIGELLEVDPTIVRLVVVIVAIVTGIIPLLVGYLVAWWIVPSEGELKG